MSKRNYNVGEINYPVFSPDLTIQESSKLDSSHPKEGNKITTFIYILSLSLNNYKYVHGVSIEI